MRRWKCRRKKLDWWPGFEHALRHGKYCGPCWSPWRRAVRSRRQSRLWPHPSGWRLFTTCYNECTPACRRCARRCARSSRPRPVRKPIHCFRRWHICSASFLIGKACAPSFNGTSNAHFWSEPTRVVFPAQGSRQYRRRRALCAPRSGVDPSGVLHRRGPRLTLVC